MLQFKRNLLSVALASATMMLATGAHAQSPEPQTEEPQTAEQAEEARAAAARRAAEQEATNLDGIVVTGIRRGIQDAIATKQASTSIVESISAEDIGKLPDTSIADSIARLPGLTAQRFGNRPQEINIRGFAGDFSTALLNGREQVSLGNNRGVEFDQYPSELMNQVVVYKTPDASLIGQGLSGTVDLRTVRPLSFPDRVVAVNLRGDMNEIEHDDDKLYGNRFSISYIDQFADDTVGLALGYARLNNPTQSHLFEGWGYDNGVIQGSNVFDVEGDNIRDGLMGVLEYKPNDMYSSTLDLFYSKFDREETKQGFQFSLQSWTGAALNGRTNNPDGTATEARFSNVNNGVIRNDFNASYDNLFAIGWNHELKLNEDWTFNADISHSSADRDERILETYAKLQGSSDVVATLNPDGYFDYDFSLDLTNPANFRLMDPGGWGGDRAQAGYLKDFRVKDQLTSVRMDLERIFESGMFSSLEFGANLTDRTKSRASDENTLCLTAACTDNTGAPIPSQFLTGGLTFAGIPFLGLDALGLLNNFYILKPKNHPDISKKNWDVNEKVTTVFVQANIDTDLGSIPVRGNIGVQAVNVDQSSRGFQTLPFGASGGETEDGAAYTHYLPSLNLAFELPWAQFVRFGAARQMARPRMDDLRTNNDVFVDLGTSASLPDEFRGRRHYVMSGGNSKLEPWIANAYDVSWEKYFGGTKGYVSAAYFFKDLQTYIYNQNGTFDIRDTALPPALQDPTIAPIGRFFGPANGNGGFVRGHELAVSIPLDMLWAPLEGFGIQANYSDTDSSIQPQGPEFPNEPLPGLSKYVSNVTVYFERWGFSARASQRHRSEFVGEVQGFGGDRTRTSFGAETVTDVQMGYTFQNGPLQNLSLLLQVNNLENEPFQTLTDGRPNTFSEYGRTYLFGVNYKF